MVWMTISEAGAGTGADGATVPLDRRSTRKRDEILAVARDQFLKNGFIGTSIDSVVEIIGGSKSTIYSHFKNKEQLFAAVIRAASHDADAADFPVRNGIVRDELLAFARDRLGRVVSPLNIGVMRMVIAEADRMPGLARLFYRQAPEPTYRALETYLAAAAADGKLRVSDPAIDAEALLGALLQKALLARLFGTMDSPDDTWVADHARDAVDAFLALRQTVART